jgi:hypothetical protein
LIRTNKQIGSNGKKRRKKRPVGLCSISSSKQYNRFQSDAPLGPTSLYPRVASEKDPIVTVRNIICRCTQKVI